MYRMYKNAPFGPAPKMSRSKQCMSNGTKVGQNGSKRDIFSFEFVAQT